eukprot:CAMPEP_0117450044 /NCGR_PEP_ID=MMETSP0759-20121206/8261_1 /TAXON_ID=63605 /ORGANISM="Percolomonas cosmopolitus, Strain WS" /LENGTH=256 /DNA_ID=CAMNT_0005242545 /DNA_START=43 /DNA_END=813 /DNA_ORIENTATION=+
MTTTTTTTTLTSSGTNSPIDISLFDRIPGLLGILVTNAEGALIDKALSPHLPSTPPIPLTSPLSPTSPNPSLTSLCASHLLSLEQSAKLGREYGRNRAIVAFYEVEEGGTEGGCSSVKGNECVIVQYVWRGMNTGVSTHRDGGGSGASSGKTDEHTTNGSNAKGRRSSGTQSLTDPSTATTTTTITQKFQQMMQQRDQHSMELEDEALLFTFVMGAIRENGNGEDLKENRQMVYLAPAVGLMRELAPQIAESFALG